MNEWLLFEFRASIAVCVNYSLLASLWLQRLHGLSEAVGGWCRGARCFCLVSIIDCSISAESAVHVVAMLLTSAVVGVLTVEFTHLSKRICARHVRDRYITHLAASGARQLYVHTVWWLDVQLIPLSYGRTIAYIPGYIAISQNIKAKICCRTFKISQEYSNYFHWIAETQNCRVSHWYFASISSTSRDIISSGLEAPS